MGRVPVWSPPESTMMRARFQASMKRFHTTAPRSSRIEREERNPCPLTLRPYLLQHRRVTFLQIYFSGAN
jgi:hypothetical protein